MMQKTSTTDIIEHYLDLHQLQLALQEVTTRNEEPISPDSPCVDSTYAKATHLFLTKEAERLGVPSTESTEELLVQINKETDKYGQQHSEVLSDAISDKDVDNSVTRMMYKLLAFVEPEPKSDT